jgi:hypothetical protein
MLEERRTDPEPADSKPAKLHQDPTRYRRARRAELVGVTLAFSMSPGALLFLPAPGWMLGAILLATVLTASAAAARVRWNAAPPTLIIDPVGITYQRRHLGITLRDRSLRDHLAWPEIDRIEISQTSSLESAATLVSVRPLQPEGRRGIAFQPHDVGASEADLTAALRRFAPSQLASLVDTRRTRLR